MVDVTTVAMTTKVAIIVRAKLDSVSEKMESPAKVDNLFFVLFYFALIVIF